MCLNRIATKNKPIIILYKALLLCMSAIDGHSRYYKSSAVSKETQLINETRRIVNISIIIEIITNSA